MKPRTVLVQNTDHKVMYKNYTYHLLNLHMGCGVVVVTHLAKASQIKKPLRTSGTNLSTSFRLSRPFVLEVCLAVKRHPSTWMPQKRNAEQKSKKTFFAKIALKISFLLHLPSSG